MALSAAQKTQVDALKALLADFKKSMMESPTAFNMFGSHLFTNFQALENKISDLEKV